MARVPGTFARLRRLEAGWALIDNPAFAGKTPRALNAVCHDGSPFVTIQCSCGFQLHQHESSVAHVPDDAEVASTCPGCGQLLVFPPGWFRAAFAELRAMGWVE